MTSTDNTAIFSSGSRRVLAVARGAISSDATAHVQVDSGVASERAPPGRTGQRDQRAVVTRLISRPYPAVLPLHAAGRQPAAWNKATTDIVINHDDGGP